MTLSVASVHILLALAVLPDPTSALLQVVDSPLMPEEAATIEETPYRMLLDRVRFGPGQAVLAAMAGEFSYDALREEPDRFRGEIVFVGAGIVVELRRCDGPGVGRFNGDEIYAGIVAELDARRGDICLWTWRLLRKRGDPILYPGDVVHLSGYFLKNMPVLDARGTVRWMPLAVGPWPRYTGRWMPFSAMGRSWKDLLPSVEFPHERLRSRTVLTVLSDGSCFIGMAGPFLPEQVSVLLEGLSTARKRRAAVAAYESPSGRALAEGLLRGAGFSKIVQKELRRP